MKTILIENGAIQISHKGDAPLAGEVADNIVTTMASNHPLVVNYGDDIPLVFYSKSKNLIGACLLTKERLENDFLKTGMKEVIARYGLLSKDVSVYVGPGLTFAHVVVDREELLSVIAKGYTGAAKRTEGVDFIDLQVLATYQLRAVGIPFDNITIDSNDTFESDDLFYSPLRGDKELNSISIVTK